MNAPQINFCVKLIHNMLTFKAFVAYKKEANELKKRPEAREPHSERE